MPATDKAAFTALIAKTWRFYEKTPTAETVADWFDVLEGIPLDAIAIAFKRHLTDPKAGQYLPKPGDIIRQIHAAQPDQGHPGPEEAWGLLLRFANDERETGLYTEPMRQAWEACGPILKAGDEIGARMCFLETYRKALKRAIETRTPPKWSLSMGSDLERRKIALQTAVAQGWISADYAQSLLPAPVANLEEMAGLLEYHGPKADIDQPTLSEQFRALAARLRASQADEETRSMQAEREHHEAINAQKAQIKSGHENRTRRTA